MLICDLCATGKKINFTKGTILSSLISSTVLLADAQLAEIYRVCSEALYTERDLNCEQEKILGDIQSRVESLIPDVIEQMRAQSQPQISQQQNFSS